MRNQRFQGYKILNGERSRLVRTACCQLHNIDQINQIMRRTGLMSKPLASLFVHWSIIYGDLFLNSLLRHEWHTHTPKTFDVDVIQRETYCRDEDEEGHPSNLLCVASKAIYQNFLSKHYIQFWAYYTSSKQNKTKMLHNSRTVTCAPRHFIIYIGSLGHY